MPGAADDDAAIRQVLARYARGIDRLDEGLILSAYWEDAVDYHGAFNGAPKAFAAWVIPGIAERYRMTSHMLCQSLIETAGNDARVETYFLAVHIGKGDDHARQRTVAGRYVDRMQRREGQWRILERHVVIDWADEGPHSNAAAGAPGAVRELGAQDRSDPSYALFA